MGPPLLCAAVAGRRSIDRALEPAESLRANLGGRDLRTSYRASVHRYYETQLDVLMQLHKVRAGRGSPGCRCPDSRGRGEAAGAILAAAPGGTSVARLGFNASREAATSVELAQFRTVHFATHGVLDSESPGMSGIMLSMFDGQGRAQDGFLRLHDIYGLRLPAELVVLSACSTALGSQVSGEGLVGIVRGFMYAGAKRVVASLWKVDDEATGELMRGLYAGMLRDGHYPAAALRAAQLAVRQQPRWRSPFYWAAFSLQVEWKASDGS